jgi:hypothetical protein
MKIVERLTRTSHDTIQYEATVQDPLVFVAPYKLSYPLKYEPDYQLFEYSCHDGNYALKNLITEIDLVGKILGALGGLGGE